MNHTHYFNSVSSYEAAKGRKPEAIIISTKEFQRVIDEFGPTRPIQSFTIDGVHAMASDEVKDGECILID